MPDKTVRSATIASVDKAIRVLERLAEPGREPVTLSALATELGINKSSLHHTLATLRDRAWVEQDTEGRYRLGPASSIVARWWGSPSTVTSLLRPALAHICTESHETVHLGRPSGASVVYLDKLEPDRAVRVVSKVGRMVPVATTAMGRAILGASGVTAADVDEWVAAAPDARPGLAERVAQECERVRLSGYAVEIEENEQGIACVGVPVLIHDQVAAAISVTMPIERCSQDRLRSLAATITEAVNTMGVPDVRVY